METLHPDVYTQERGLNPSVTGASTSTAAFVGTARRGRIDELGFVTSFREFETVYGTDYPDSYLEDSVFQFFENGGQRAYIAGVKGSGNASATSDGPAIGGAASAAQIDGTGVAPFNLEPADSISISVDGAAAQVFSFTATRGIHVAGGPAVPPAAGGETIVVQFDGGALQSVTFTAAATSADLIAAEINAQVVGGRCVNVAGTLQLESDTRGSGSSAAVDATSSAGGLTLTGFTAGSTAGGGNVVNIDAVTITEVLSLLSTLAGATASDNSGAVRVTHDTPGLAFTLEVTAAAAAFVFPAGQVTGSDSAQVPLYSVTARHPGADGDNFTFSTERWRANTTSLLSTGGTSVDLDDVSKVELGDVVTIDDGTTSVNVHVTALDVANKRISFQAVTLGAPIAIGAIANSASSHRVNTSLTVEAIATATEITVLSSSQIRIGTELSLDDGTTLIFRVVTAVNGNKLTLNAAVGAVFAVGTPVYTHYFDLTLYQANQFVRTHAYLSMQSTDTRDYIEIRLAGEGNESIWIELADLAPTIATPIEDRAAPVVDQALAGGQDGAVPTDNDYIGTTSPASGLQLINELRAGEVNIVAIPGITSVAVQQALTDFAEARKDVVALIDTPLSLDEPTEVRDWRLNQHNRSSTYSAMYYPWLKVRDRHSSSSDVTKSIPPSGPVAGLYARVDREVGVWEAPGNKGLRQVIEPVVRVSDGQQDILNPIGVNVIRTFPGEGPRVWGIRTLATIADGRQYVHIRRLLNYDKLSIAAVLRPFIFAGIQPSLFAKIVRTVTAFHRSLWRQGALFPNDDFSAAQYVKCDAENNPAESRRQGQLYVDAGIQPPFPAEFIIFRIALWDGETTIDELVS